jgi:hypothetical protein
MIISMIRTSLNMIVFYDNEIITYDHQHDQDINHNVMIIRYDHDIIIIISGSACSTVGVPSQAWSTSGIGRLGSKSGRG